MGCCCWRPEEEVPNEPEENVMGNSAVSAKDLTDGLKWRNEGMNLGRRRKKRLQFVLGQERLQALRKLEVSLLPSTRVQSRFFSQVCQDLCPLDVLSLRRQESEENLVFSQYSTLVEVKPVKFANCVLLRRCSPVSSLLARVCISDWRISLALPLLLQFVPPEIFAPSLPRIQLLTSPPLIWLPFNFFW